jgi:hypothetical protein
MKKDIELMKYSNELKKNPQFAVTLFCSFVHGVKRKLA